MVQLTRETAAGVTPGMRIAWPQPALFGNTSSPRFLLENVVRPDPAQNERLPDPLERDAVRHCDAGFPYLPRSSYLLRSERVIPWVLGKHDDCSFGAFLNFLGEASEVSEK